MPPLHSEAVGRLVEWAGPPEDDVLRAMEARAERDGFPTVGPEVGRTVALCTRLTGARTVLELGSGFGYSAYWIARALPADGSVTLTERDEGLLDAARSYFERGDLLDKAIFEHGDALEIAEAQDGPFDLVVLDHDTADYVRGFETVRKLLAPGGTIVTDNVAVYDDVHTPENVLATLDGEPAPNDRVRVVAAFLERVHADPEFETYVLPVDEGVAISSHVG
ncbi:methyltransferase [Haladaptatus sp. R4]|uniref:O-methyltransferase n=1 Tax=Haladaptatus sp. R4 TaxID=1679489 RepID=UPI0007B4DABD|nr:O-methyltransferase [Haladaptatus sp. R4]KZN23941.1 methyltransferase [Haladaptatus sp. R4]